MAGGVPDKRLSSAEFGEEIPWLRRVAVSKSYFPRDSAGASRLLLLLSALEAFMMHKHLISLILGACSVAFARSSCAYDSVDFFILSASDRAHGVPPEESVWSLVAE